MHLIITDPAHLLNFSGGIVNLSKPQRISQRKNLGGSIPKNLWRHVSKFQSG
ncbi:hypothetical protein P872_18575 [Rhodonellum psychrophilum GCM71 = DSM 17998]|uniref:Uncharacterized protein n=1 Tax=Rhodonellum psychrophilum GCM71 = DSM 17998 TaxID=1123057 RepID=U5C052_9BACT|nr:hypothetical protein P872_18575 [Rhodonellum psychrophilum GCM71 = DSM 17998]